jgi:DNA polymerase-3 subunit gamma/tau
VLQNLAGFYRDLLIAKTAAGRQDLVAITPPTWADMQTLVQSLDPALLLMGQQHLRSAEAQVKNTTQPRLWLEVTLLGLLPSIFLESHTQSIHILRQRESNTVDQQNTFPSINRKDLVKQSQEGSQTLEPRRNLHENIDPKINIADKERNEPLKEEQSRISEEMSQGIPASSDRENINREQTWNSLLNLIKNDNPTTMALLCTGTLLEFDGVTARLGISSQWFSKPTVNINDRKGEIEGAFLKLLKRKITVVFEPIDTGKSVSFRRDKNSNDTQKKTLSGNFSSNPDRKVERLENDSYIREQGSDTHTHIGESRKGSVRPKASDKSNIPSSSAILENAHNLERQSQILREDASVLMPPLPEIASDFDRAVKNFAQFFNGQVVDIDDDLDALLGGPSPKPSKAAANQPSHPDKDVPF